MATILLLGPADPVLVAAVVARGFSPSRDGASACATLAIGSVMPRPLPTLMVVAHEAAVIAALDAGADDAVAHTASPALIAARLAALVRRTQCAAPLRIGTLTIDSVDRRVARDGRELGLLPREYLVLLHLARHAGQIVPREALRRAVWGRDFDPGTNVIEVHVSRLRGKLDRGFAEPMLRTERGAGYRLVATPAER